jgi:CubicO group peptidase (beta-lactamase class C family)
MRDKFADWFHTLRHLTAAPLQAGLNSGLSTVASVSLLVLFPCAVCLGQTTGGRINIEQAVDSIVSDWTSPTDPGLAVAVVWGESVFTKGYGMANLEHGVPITASTAFNLGSVSKQFTGFAVAMLVDQGLISLDADVRTYLPELKIKEKVSVRQLVDHTSGFRDEANLLGITGYWMEDAVTPEEVLRMLLRQEELMFSPGGQWEYSNSGYTLLAEIISRVTGVPFVEWTESKLFAPLGMKDTRFLPDRTRVIPHMAVSYDIGADNSFIRTPVSYSNVGPTNLVTTADDLVKWARNLLQPTIGSRCVLQLYGIPGVLTSGDTTDYAFGQFVGERRGLRRFLHSGTIGSFNCGMVRYSDQQFVIAVLSNSSLIKPITVANQITDVLLKDDFEAIESLADKSDTARSGKKEAEPKAVPLSTYVGKYRLQETGKVLEITKEEEILFLVNISDHPLPLMSDKNGGFSLGGGVGAKVTFDLDENDQSVQMVLYFGATLLAAPRVHVFDMPPDKLNTFSGLYYSEELIAVYDLAVESGKLLAKHCRYPDIELTPMDSLAFTGSKQWLRDVSFEKDPQGRINGFRASSARAKNVYFRKLE